jgi:hypothetical protein
MDHAINVLVNGSVEKPAIWVFDPHNRHDGVFRAYIESDDHLERIIAQIHQRLKAAADAT